MQVSDFAVGVTYDARKVDFEPPDGSPTVKGKDIRFTVLEPADRFNSKVREGSKDVPPTTVEVDSWRRFLRVRNLSTGRVHLMCPETIEAANPVGQ